MKRRFLLGIATVAVAALALTGCGKTPTLEDIKDNLGEGKPTTANVTATINFSGEGEIDDTNDYMDMILEYLEDEGMDLSDGIEADLEMTATAEMVRGGDYGHSTSEISVDFDSNIDMLNESLEDYMDKAGTTTETYFDYDEELKYTYDNEDEEWYVSDLDDDDDDSSFEELNDGLESIIDFAISYNEEHDKDEQFKVAKDGKNYVISWDATIDQDFMDNLSKSDKKNIQKLFDALEIDYDFDDLVSLYEDYGDVVTIEIPVSFDISFTTSGKGKNTEYVFNGIKAEVSGTVSTSLDEDEVEELLENAGAGSGMSCSVEASATLSVAIEMTIGYDEQEEVEIPKKVVKNAIEY